MKEFILITTDEDDGAFSTIEKAREERDYILHCMADKDCYSGEEEIRIYRLIEGAPSNPDEMTGDFAVCFGQDEDGSYINFETYTEYSCAKKDLDKWLFEYPEYRETAHGIFIIYEITFWVTTQKKSDVCIHYEDGFDCEGCECEYECDFYNDEYDSFGHMMTEVVGKKEHEKDE
jgi:hypothetical protein